MGKHDALGAFLRRWKVLNGAEGVELGFAQIESIIGGLLPRGAAELQWWCCSSSGRSFVILGGEEHVVLLVMRPLFTVTFRTVFMRAWML